MLLVFRTARSGFEADLARDRVPEGLSLVVTDQSGLAPFLFGLLGDLLDVGLLDIKRRVSDLGRRRIHRAREGREMEVESQGGNQR